MRLIRWLGLDGYTVADAVIDLGAVFALGLSLACVVVAYVLINT